MRPPARRSRQVLPPRALAYVATAVFLGASGFWLRGLAWQGGPALHTLMEAIATLLALYVGTLALIRYFSQQDGQFLYIGAGFIGTAMLDGYHAVVTSTFFQPFMPSGNETLVPWSWLASRLYLSALMVMSWLLWRANRRNPAFRASHRRVFVVTAGSTVATFLVFGFMPLPQFIHPGALFPRPFDLIPGGLFLVALAGYLGKGKWRTDAFEHWLVLSLIVGAAMQFSFMSFSGSLYDLEFDVAHLLKKLSYVLVLVGLLVNLRQTYALIQDESARRKLAEEEAQRGRRQLFAILEGLPGFVYLQAPDYSIRFANRYFRDHFGDPEGATCHARLTGRDKPCVPCPTLRVLATGKPEIWEASQVSDGRTYQIYDYPFTDESGQALVLEFGIDITARKQAELELQRYRDHLEALVEERTAALSIAKEFAEAASRAKSTFLANMSHELRTPMNAIMGMTAIVLRHADDPVLRDRLGKIDKASQHLLGVINDILDISKIEAEQLTLEQRNFILGEVLENLDSLLGQRAAEKGLQFRIEVPPALARLALRGDALRLGQILLNLAGNAVKFTAAGSVTLCCHPAEEGPGDVLLRFEVRDTGIGIAAADQQRLFNAFEQADGSMTRKYGGTGLGLAISKRLARLMRGDIGVASQPGVGSTFWFTARLDKAGAGELPTAVPAPAAVGPAADERLLGEFAGARILLAEDEPINQEVARGLLEDAGLTVDVADDGAVAVDLARKNRYALILMDMQMPNLNGVDATKAIRALPGHAATPILAMTANAFEEDRRRCIEAGMNDHIAKPVDPDRLFETLLKWLTATRG